MEFIDSHAHLSGSEYIENIDTILKRAESAQVKKIINICTDKETLIRGLELSKKYPQIYNAASTTPHDASTEGESLFPLISNHAKKRDLVAIGETGLDYHYEHSPKKTQKEIFIRYLHLALECQLPIIIHCRDAFNDFFDIIDAEYKSSKGILHCFTGTVEEAKQLIKRGWTISLSGIVTFKKSEALREAAKIIPLEHLLIETDAPYLAPQSKRGKVNEPSYLPEVAALLAILKNVSVEKVAEATSFNAHKLFNLPN